MHGPLTLQELFESALFQRFGSFRGMYGLQALQKQYANGFFELLGCVKVDAWAAGIAGGGPGYGQATGGATVGTIYDPSQPIGSRWRQVADSLIKRFYHSVATLTQNAEVLVTGSEATVDYRVQIYTPG